MSRRATVLIAALSVAAGFGISAFAAGPGANPTTSASGDARVPGLVALSPEERRTALRAMSKEDRKSIWFELKRALAAANRGQAPAVKGHDVQPKATAPRTPSSNLGPTLGTIQYDSGAITTSFNIGAIVGNRFSTHTGAPVLNPGTVTEVQAVVVQGSAFTTSSAGFVILGPQTSMGGAFAIDSTFTAADGGTTDTVTFTGLAATYTQSFYVLFGDFNNSYVPAFGPGTVNGQGHHGVIGITGGMGPNITATSAQSTLNAFVRATGQVLPVELMSFDVD